MIWERRADLVSYLGLSFVAGWMACQAFYGMTTHWKHEEALTAQVQKAQSDCETLRHGAILAMLEAQDDGATPDWGKIKPCPKSKPVPLPKK